MFTGIITDLGTIATLNHRNGGCDLSIRCSYDMATINIGASIGCNGICLTVTAKEANIFHAHASAETLAVTTLGRWHVGDRINLERALKLGDELGGHIVQGHVDGVAKIQSITAEGECHHLTLSLPTALAHLAAAKGSIAIDGISLTVNRAQDTLIHLMMIPHTWQQTNLHLRRPNDEVNVEMDMMARYLERMATTGVLRG